MKIIIVGLGKVGYAIAQQMVGEEHDLILVDESAAVIEHADATLDAMCVEGNGACASVLLRAGVRDADLVIAATADDEVNLVCSLMAKKLGAKHTVARVRNPEYFRDAPILRREIGLDMIINPEYAAAQEIARILRVPAAFSVESFARGTVELIGFQITEQDGHGRQEPDRIQQAPSQRAAAVRGQARRRGGWCRTATLSRRPATAFTPSAHRPRPPACCAAWAATPRPSAS